MSQIVQDGALTGSEIELWLHVVPDSGSISYYTRSLKNGERLLPAGYIKPGTRSTGGGYRIVSIPVRRKTRRQTIRAHRLVWMWVHGEWPNGEIDHVNGNRDDNRIDNLRLATVSQNRINKGMQRNNTCGFKWVQRCPGGKYKVLIAYRENGIKKRFEASGFKTPDAAYDVASAFAKSVHGEFYNPGKR